MDQYTRRIIGFGIKCTNTLDGYSVCGMFNKIIIHNKNSLPKNLSSDNDPLFTFYRWQANLRILEIEEIKTVPYVPMSHPYIERLIGTIRREYMDKILFFNEKDLEKKLKKFADYYNNYRVHVSLETTPGDKAEDDPIKEANFNNYAWKSHCKGLFYTPCAA